MEVPCALVGAMPTKPHLVILMVDDVGYNDVGWRNSAVSTPFLDALLTNRSEPTTVLTRHYTYPICSPTRSSLLTGRMPARVNQMNVGADMIDQSGSSAGEMHGGIDLRMQLLPQVLRRAGYATAHVGKWHCGASQIAQMPARRGFETSFGYMSGCIDHGTMEPFPPSEACGAGTPVVDLWDGTSPTDAVAGLHSCELFARRAVTVIEKHGVSLPLFLYAAFPEAHEPYTAAPSKYEAHAIADATLRSYRGMIACNDAGTAAIVGALKRQRMWNNTLLLWASDNGATTFVPGGHGAMYPVDAPTGSNAPFRGGKSTMYEGGVRTVALLAGGVLPPDVPTRVDAPVHVADWFATFAALAGVSDWSDPGAREHGLPGVDGVNMWPLLSRGTRRDNELRGEQSARSEIMLGTSIDKCYHAALIQGNWKLMVDMDSLPVDKQESFAFDCLRDEGAKNLFALYDLDADPSEQTNLANSSDWTMVLKRDAMIKRLRQLADEGEHQTGFSSRYLSSSEGVGGPLRAMCAARRRTAREGRRGHVVSSSSLAGDTDSLQPHSHRIT